MLCDDYKRVVYFFLDGSLSQRRVLELQTHISICHDCEKRTLLHRKLRDFVRKRLAPVSAPEHLKIRLVQSLRVVAE
jgi:mycothiol system anti-sigma-R factor